MKMSDKVYDVLKFISWFWGPLFIFVTAIVNIWFFDSKNFEQIVGTLSAIDLLIGSLVSNSNIKFRKENDIYSVKKASEE